MATKCSTGCRLWCCQHGVMSAALPVACICGPSAAGKSTVAQHLAEALRQQGRQPLLITCDNYYRHDWQPGSRYGYDTVAAIDGEALRHELSSARYGQCDMLRHYDMRTRRVSRQPVTTPYDLVLLEGSYGPQLLEGFPLAALVYLETPLLLRFWRRLRRDVRDRQRSPLYVIRQMLMQMLPGERRFIHPLKHHASHVLRGDRTDLGPVLDLLA